MRAHFRIVPLFILLASLGFLASASLAAKGPSRVRKDVARMLSVALAEAPTDFTNLATIDPRKGMVWIKPFGHVFSKCEVGYLTTTDGMPKTLLCRFKPIPDSMLVKYKAEILSAVNASGFGNWDKGSSSSSGMIWTSGNQFLELEITPPAGKKKMRTLYLGFGTAIHLRYSPLGPTVAHFLDKGLAAASTKFNAMPVTGDEGDGFYGVAAVFGESFQHCRVYVGTFECFSPDLVDSPEAQLQAAKMAVSHALPASFVLHDCGRNVGNMPVCSWRGPNHVSVNILIQPSSAPDSKLNYIRLSIDTEKD